MYKIAVSVLILGFMSGCTINAVQYQPDFNLVNEQKDHELAKMNVGDITSQNAKVNKISIRGVSMVSTINKSYADYLKVALQEQLLQAGLYDASSVIEISGGLLVNKVNAAGFSVGTADISARFEVTNKNSIKFNKVITITHEWKSSFIGSIAMERALANYPLAVQKLLSALMSDPDFLVAVK